MVQEQARVMICRLFEHPQPQELFGEERKLPQVVGKRSLTLA